MVVERNIDQLDTSLRWFMICDLLNKPISQWNTDLQWFTTIYVYKMLYIYDYQGRREEAKVGGGGGGG